MKHAIILLAIIIFSYSIKADALMIVEEKYDKPQDEWIAPNNLNLLGEYFINANGYLCENIIYQVEVNSMMQPARKCRMPDGAWQTFLD